MLLCLGSPRRLSDEGECLLPKNNNDGYNHNKDSSNNVSNNECKRHIRRLIILHSLLLLYIYTVRCYARYFAHLKELRDL